MAKELSEEQRKAQEERARLKNEKKQLKKDQAAAKKEAKKRAAEIEAAEEELEEGGGGNGFVTFLATLFIIVLWIGVICVVIKMDIGGFGSTVLTPILKDVPVVNKILPGNTSTYTKDGESYGGYTNLQDAVNQIYELERQLEIYQTGDASKDERIKALEEEVTRLSEFEKMQVEFQRIRNEFYEEVIYAENGPGAEAYVTWYETMDPTTAQTLYKQVVADLEASAKVKSYAQAYAEMEPKDAAEIFEKMTDTEGLNIAAQILENMDAQSRGKILAEMDATVAAKLTKIMKPGS
jgi:flagellar motility protein MotE (MotC chaperone)